MLHTISGYQLDLQGPPAEELIKTSPVTDPKEQMANHLTVLKIYASRVLDEDDLLLPWEEIDKRVRFNELFALGNSFECTQRDLVRVLYRDLFRTRSR